MARRGLYANIHAKRKRGEKMRKKGEKGAPTEAQMKAARGMKAGGVFKANTEAVVQSCRIVEKLLNTHECFT